ncbi:MAG: alpha/beta fold hydrolase [Candidatus Korobacteraceae bacterium]
MKVAFLSLVVFLASAATAQQRSTPSYGPNLERFAYPHPVNTFKFESQRQALTMAHMDVPAAKPNGHTVVLLHGKNFCAATWESLVRTLSTAGYRVVVPDQIGFCKSTKPEHYQYTLHQLADNTHRLLEQLGITRAVILGHSMGGMLAFRYALMFPQQTQALVVVNPLGLEDWKAKGVPYQTVDAAYQGQLRTTFESIKAYQLSTYYVGQWKPEYDQWVEMQAGMFNGEGRELVAWNQALTSEMIYSQPVMYEFPNIKVPSLLLIGERDTTAPGKNLAPRESASTLGNYDELGRAAAKAIPNARLVPFPELGHSPHIQEPERFSKALLENLAEMLRQ